MYCAVHTATANTMCCTVHTATANTMCCAAVRASSYSKSSMRLARHKPWNFMDLFSGVGIGKEGESKVGNLIASVSPFI